ncbi:unnamed protein product [Rotaria magnacalcarata]
MCTFEILWSLAFSDDIASVLRTNSNFLDKIQSIAKDNKDESVKKVIDELVWKLVEEPIFLDKYESIRIICIGPAMSAMADTVENSKFVLLSMSDSCKQITYCQAESEYAFKHQVLSVTKAQQPTLSFLHKSINERTESDVIDFLLAHRLDQIISLCDAMNARALSELYNMCASHKLRASGVTRGGHEVINVPSSAPNTSLSSSSATPLPPTITSKTRVTTTALLPPTAITTAAPQPIITTTTIANHNPLKPLSGMSFVPALNLLTSYDFSIVTNISALDTFKMAEHYSSQLLIFDLLRRRMMNTY